MDKGLVRDKISQIARIYFGNPVTLSQALLAYVENLLEQEARVHADELAKKYCDRQCSKPGGLMCRACFEAIAMRAGRRAEDLLVRPKDVVVNDPIEVEPLPESEIDLS